MASTTTWHPVLASHELRCGENIVGALAQGQELVLWRSQRGAAQAWENRCPHRGVRLTLGRLVNGRLSCAYHGWEYAADSGRCERIPAMPDVPVPGKVCVKTFEVIEAQSMVWVGLGAATPGGDAPDAAVAPPAPAAPDSASNTLRPGGFCRTLALRCSINHLHQGLLRRGFQNHAASTWHGTLAALPVVGFTLAGEIDLSFIHLWCAAEPAGPARQALFAAARRLRADLETGAG